MCGRQVLALLLARGLASSTINVRLLALSGRRPAALKVGDIQQREGRWVLVDLVGK